MAADLTNYLQEGIDLHTQLEAIQEKIWDFEEELSKEVDETFIAEEIYIENECGKNPRNKKTNKYSRPKGLAKLLIGVGVFFVMIIFSVIMFVNGVNISSQKNIFQELKTNPGVSYEQWVEGWDDVTYFEELSNTWQLVQQDWKSRGAEVSWADVIATKEKHFKYVTTIRPDPLLERICNDKMEKYNPTNKYAFGVVGIVLAVLLLIYCIKIESSRISILKEYNNEQQKNAKLEREYIIWAEKCEKAKDRWKALREEHFKNIEKERICLNQEKEQLKKEKNKWTKKFNVIAKKVNAYDAELKEKIIEAGRDIPEELRFGWIDYETTD